LKSRKLQKRVSIYESTTVSDTFGGNTVTFKRIAERWCNIEDVKANSFQNIAGITDFTNVFKFTFRYDEELIINPKRHKLEHKGLDYEIIDVKTDGFRNVSQVVTAKQVLGLD